VGKQDWRYSSRLAFPSEVDRALACLVVVEDCGKLVTFVVRYPHGRFDLFAVERAHHFFNSPLCYYGSSRKKVGKSQSIMSIQPNKIKDF
jgi:hypothetical protein